jgi:ABC-2 type transport system permease protein
MKRFAVLTKAMFLMHMRNRMTLFWNLAFPIFILIIYRVAFGEGQVGDTDYMTWVVPGVVVFNILTFGLLSSGTLMVAMREKGILRRLQASPIPALSLVGSYLLVNVMIGLLQSIFIVSFAALVFGMPLTWIGVLRAFPMVIIGIVTFVAIGQVISGIAPTAGVAVAVGQVLNFSQMFITDMIMPIQTMPTWLQKVAPYLPAYAVVQLVRPPLLEGQFSPDLGFSLLVAAAYIAIATLAAARLFRWAPRA